jgi:hypothetical protein
VTESPYSVGIDLGTTNCALSFVPPDQDESERVELRTMPIPQLTSPGSIEEKPLFPSFIYLVHPGEFAPQDLALPWRAENKLIIGELARARGPSTPIRLISSAKSWLCNPGVDRRAPILPLEAPPEVEQLSPLDASTQYLEHMRDAWNQAHPDAPLQKQEVILTVPASFDPAARELTAEAARRAGIENLVLLEEPQAAFYSWVQSSGENWRKQVKIGEIILVVDVGGGTTDLSLIAVTESDGSVELRRIAVGDHILLGGDNMDLTLAHLLKAKLAEKGTELDFWQLHALTHGCRAAKEALLSDPAAGAYPVTVPSRGSKLIGKTIRTELTREEVEQVIVNGFFPLVEVMDRPSGRTRGALTRVGLPYAQDPGITRHLADFLSRQANAAEDLEGFRGVDSKSGFMCPTAILFNGGVFKSRFLLDRTASIVNGWLQKAGAPEARLLEAGDFDTAVSRGAAYYGYVRRGRGVRIRGGSARAFYVGIESAMPAVPGLEPPIQALCIAPFGMEEGTEADWPPQTFGLVVGAPVRFRFLGSSVRRQDRVGITLESWTPDEIEELNNIEATLPSDGRASGEIVPVRLRARLTEVGTLKLEAMPLAGPERWAVEFNVRGK